MSTQLRFHLPQPPYGAPAKPTEESLVEVASFAAAVLHVTGPVIDTFNTAYHYGEAFVFRLQVTGKAGQVTVDVSAVAEAVSHMDFSVVVADAVDGVTALQLIRTALKRASFTQRLTGEGHGAYSMRAHSLAPVIEWHEAQIAHCQAERARMQAWSEAHGGANPGGAFDECATRIQEHQHTLDRILDFAV